MQRIQSLYLLATTVLAILTLTMPLAYFSANDILINLYACGLRTIDGVYTQPTIYLFIALVLAAALPFITIFLHKNRLLQIRLCAVEMVLLVGSAIITGVYFYLSNRLFSTEALDPATYISGIHPIAIAPIIAIISTYLAMRGVIKDVALLRSVDRIR